MVILYVMLCIIIIVIIYNFLTRKYVNPYKLIMIFGKKGSGKTTNLTKLAIKHHKKGWTVYCTEHIPFTYYPPMFVAKLNEMVLVEFNGTNVTLLGFIGAVIIVGVMIRVFMPKP